MVGLEKMNSFNITLGTNFGLLPLLLLRLGTPLKGLLDFVNTLTAARERTEEGGQAESGLAEDFFAKLETIKEKNPEGYTKFNADAALGSNIAAGSDTTSVTLTGILFHLIQEPDVYQKLRKELFAAAARGEVSDPITFDQAQNLPYLRDVLKEGMRMHAATGLPMWRVVPKLGLTVADTFFPAGVSLFSQPFVHL